MSYCFTDSWQVIFKNDGRPLIGKLEFCDPVTTELKTIYDVDDNELDNPIYTNALPSHQIMLEGDYTVRFYEYIGPGQMEGDNSEEHWHLYKTELVKQNVIVGGNDTMGVYNTVTTIEQLKELEVPSDGSVVGVVGYYTAEDCPLRYYVWHESGNYTDDGGVYVKSNNDTQGCWVMKIPGTYIDVRWYGDIPSMYNSGEGSSLGQRVKAAQAANKFNKDLYFPSYGKGNTPGYYMFDGSNTVSVSKDIICDIGIRFVVKHDTTGTAIYCHEFKHCGSWLFVPENNQSIGTYTLTADWINTSWFYSNLSLAAGARKGYIIDTLRSPLTFRNTSVVIDTTPNMTFSLDNVKVLNCHKKINGYVSLANMEFDSEWFVDNYDYTTQLSVYTGTIINLDKCSSANLYIMLKNKMNQVDYGNLQGKSLSGATLMGNCRIENAQGTVVCSGNATIIDSTLTVTVTGSTPEFTFENSHITFGTVTLGQLIVNGGSLTGTGITAVGARTEIHNCTINIPFDFRGGNVGVVDSTINRAMTHIGSPVNEFFDNNVFNASLTISGGSANSLVNGVWVNNYGTVANPIVLDRTNLNSNDLSHTYRYSNNKGTFPADRSYKYTTSIYWDTTVGDSKFTTGKPQGENNDPFTVMCFAYSAYDNIVTHLPQINIFRIGTSDFTVKVRWRIAYMSYPQNTTYENTDCWLPYDFDMVCQYITGSNFGFRPGVKTHPVSTSGNNYFTTVIGFVRLAASGTWENLYIQGEFNFCLDP